MADFELIVRALIVRNKKILVCQTNGRDYFYLPGGHIEFSETMKQALERELREEIGAKVTETDFIGSIENIFHQNGELQHEVSFIFHADIHQNDIVSKEPHINFYWMDYDEFIDSKIAPPVLKDAIIKWTAEKKPFFIQANEHV